MADALAMREVRKPEAQIAFEILRLIILLGWALYPIGYVVGAAGGKNEEDWLNGIYNIADLINKVAFGLAIFYAASIQIRYRCWIYFVDEFLKIFNKTFYQGSAVMNNNFRFFQALQLN